MFQEHYPPLVVAYLVGLAGWFAAWRLLRGVWPAGTVERFAHPWREFGLALLGALGIVAMGQLWSRGIKLPTTGALGPLLGALNQLLIFAPILLVVLLRRQSRASVWLPAGRLGVRLLVGAVLACLAVTTYALLRRGADAPGVLLGRIARYDNLSGLVQVLLEDVTIAILFVRLAAAMGGRGATLVVAALFAAGHIPALLAHGTTGAELLGLLRDAALGVAVIATLQRSRDVAWFWLLHFGLDMTQFARVSGVG